MPGPEDRPPLDTAALPADIVLCLADLLEALGRMAGTLRAAVSLQAPHRGQAGPVLALSGGADAAGAAALRDDHSRSPRGAARAGAEHLSFIAGALAAGLAGSPDLLQAPGGSDTSTTPSSEAAGPSLPAHRLEVLGRMAGSGTSTTPFSEAAGPSLAAPAGDPAAAGPAAGAAAPPPAPPSLSASASASASASSAESAVCLNLGLGLGLLSTEAATRPQLHPTPTAAGGEEGPICPYKANENMSGCGGAATVVCFMVSKNRARTLNTCLPCAEWLVQNKSASGYEAW